MKSPEVPEQPQPPQVDPFNCMDPFFEQSMATITLLRQTLTAERTAAVEREQALREAVVRATAHASALEQELDALKAGADAPADSAPPDAHPRLAKRA